MASAPRHVLLSRGYRLGRRYKLLYPYAQGGMATVWLARVRGRYGFEKLFAVKTILPHLAKDAAFRSMFLDEARIASRIRHGNVAEVVDLGEDAGVLYMVIEWIHGDPWSKLNAAVRASGDPVPVDVMLRIAAGACAGLHAAHEQKDESGAPLHVVHRDVSPQNVLVTEAGTVKVIDFGVAKAADRSSEQTRAGLLKGKLEYMAPEQASGRPIDRRADIWAMGAVLYEIFAGRPPYEAGHDLLLLEKAAAGDAPDALPAGTPPDVMTVIERALEPHRERRFETALDLQRALEACIRSPIRPDDVAACVHHYLGTAIAARKAAIADALDEAAELSQAQGTSDLWRDDAEPPALPPQSTHDAPPAPRSSPSLATPPPGQLAPERRLTPANRLWLLLATLFTITLWVHALAALSRGLSQGAPHAPLPERSDHARR